MLEDCETVSITYDTSDYRLFCNNIDIGVPISGSDAYGYNLIVSDSLITVGNNFEGCISRIIVFDEALS